MLGVEAVLASGEVVDCLSRFPQQHLYNHTTFCFFLLFLVSQHEEGQHWLRPEAPFHRFRGHSGSCHQGLHILPNQAKVINFHHLKKLAMIKILILFKLGLSTWHSCLFQISQACLTPSESAKYFKINFFFISSIFLFEETFDSCRAVWVRFSRLVSSLTREAWTVSHRCHFVPTLCVSISMFYVNQVCFNV